MMRQPVLVRLAKPRVGEITQGRTTSDGGISRDTRPKKLFPSEKNIAVVAIQVIPPTTNPIPMSNPPIDFRALFMCHNLS